MTVPDNYSYFDKSKGMLSAMDLKGSGNTNLTQDTGTLSLVTFNCQLYRFIMSVGLTGSLCFFGIVGNVLTLLVFSKFNRNSTDKKSRSSATLLLSGLAVSDILLLLTLLIVKVSTSLISFTKIYPGFFVSKSFAFLMVYGWPCVGIAQSVNTWITVLVTMHRFIAIVSPHKTIIHCTFNKARIHLILVTILTTLYELPTFFDNEIKEMINSDNKTFYIPTYGELNLNYWYQLLYKTTFYYLTMYIVPWILLCVMTVFLIRAVKGAQKFRSKMGNKTSQQDNTEDITMPLIAVVVTSLICRPWEPVRRIMVTILKEEPGCGHYYFYFEEFPSLTAVLNSSANFVLYCIFLERFSQTLKSIFKITKPIQSTNSTATSLCTLATVNGN